MAQPAAGARRETESERVCVFKVTSPDSEWYGQWERESVCVCSKDHNRWFFVGSFRKVAKYSRILLFCLSCQQGGGPARAGGGPARARGGHERGRTGRGGARLVHYAPGSHTPVP